MFARIQRSILAMPMVQILQKEVAFTIRAATPALKWGAPLGMGALWFCFPAIDDDFKADLGLNRSTPLPPSGVKYEAEEVDTMPIVKA